MPIRRSVLGGLAAMGVAMTANAATVDTPEAPVRAMLAAWNAHDMAAMTECFSPDADWINVVGMHWRGRDQIMFALTAFHNGMFRHNQQDLKAVQTRMLTPDVAVVFVEQVQDAYTTPAGHPMPSNLNRLSLVVMRRPGGWRIVNGQNTIVDPNATANDPVLRMPRS